MATIDLTEPLRNFISSDPSEKGAIKFKSFKRLNLD